MSHYEEQKKQAGLPAVIEPVPAMSLVDLHDEITALNFEIAGAISEVQQSHVLKEFVETVRASGAMGLMGLLTKVPGVLPELAPLFPAIQKLVVVGEKQHFLTGEIIKKMGGQNVA